MNFAGAIDPKTVSRINESDVELEICESLAQA